MKTPFNSFSTKSYTNCNTTTKAKLLSTTLAETKSSKTMSTLTRLQPQAASIPQLEDCYKFAKHLGKGGEGEVDEFVNKHTGVLFAIKFRKRKERGRPLEVEILKQLSGNSRIVGFVECFDLNLDKCAIVLEHCPGGNLYGFYKKNEKSRDQAAFSEPFMWSVYKQLAEALAFIHKGVPYNGRKRQPVVHCDIKRHNILIKSLGTKRDFSSISIKLADFGLAIYYGSIVKSQSCLGSPAYWAPEMDWEDVRYTPAIDVLGYGCGNAFSRPRLSAARISTGHCREVE